jgi:hypothetical protein
MPDRIRPNWHKNQWVNGLSPGEIPSNPIKSASPPPTGVPPRLKKGGESYTIFYLQARSYAFEEGGCFTRQRELGDRPAGVARSSRPASRHATARP